MVAWAACAGWKPVLCLLVATIGQIALRKAQDVLALAAARVKSDLHYLVIGERYSKKAESQAFEESIFERFEAAGLGHRVHRLGYRDDVPALLTEIDILVHTAHQEPLGRVLSEAIFVVVRSATRGA